jgi:hypothetical protein
VGEWDHHGLSENLPVEEILADTESGRTYDYHRLIRNPSMRMKYLEKDYKHIHGKTSTIGIETIISIHIRTDIEGIRSNPDYPWNLSYLSMNNRINRYVLKNLGLTNTVGEYRQMDDIPEDMDEEIVDHLPWCPIPPEQGQWYYASKRVPLWIVEKYNMKPWVRGGLSMNEGAYLDMIYLDLPNAVGHWNYGAMAMKIPMSDIFRNLDIGWSRENISSNRGLTVRDMRILTDRKCIERILSMSDISIICSGT